MRYFIILFITLCLVLGLGAQKFLVEPENKKIAEFNYYADEYKNKELYTDEILLFSEKEVNRLLQESKNLVFNNEDTNSGELLNLYKKVIIKPNNVEEHSIYIEAEIDVYCEAYENRNLQMIQDLYSPTRSLNFRQKQV